MDAGPAVGTAATPAGRRGAAGADPVPAAPVTASARAPASDRRIDRARTETPPRMRMVRTGRGCHTDRGRTRGLPYVPAVAFDVIPAIDVSKGRLARLDGGRVVPVEAFHGDPVAAAEAFIEQGARRLHVVDVDLAFTGNPENLETISLLAVMDARIQASGGVAAEGHVAELAQAGAERVVLGSAALAERPLVERVLNRFGERIVVAV